MKLSVEAIASTISRISFEFSEVGAATYTALASSTCAAFVKFVDDRARYSRIFPESPYPYLEMFESNKRSYYAFTVKVFT